MSKQLFCLVDMGVDYQVEGVRPKKTWWEVVQKDCWTQQLNKEDAAYHGKRRKLITDTG